MSVSSHGESERTDHFNYMKECLTKKSSGCGTFMLTSNP